MQLVYAKVELFLSQQMIAFAAIENNLFPRAAPLPCLIEKPVKRLPDIPDLEMAADTGRYLDADYGAEDREVKLNLRFCDNSFHDPLIHFDFKQFTPDVSETKSNTYARQQQCTGDVLARLWGSGQKNAKYARTLTPQCMDSIVNAVFTAFDYDKENSKDACSAKE